MIWIATATLALVYLIGWGLCVAAAMALAINAGEETKRSEAVLLLLWPLLLPLAIWRGLTPDPKPDRINP